MTSLNAFDTSSAVHEAVLDGVETILGADRTTVYVAVDGGLERRAVRSPGSGSGGDIASPADTDLTVGKSSSDDGLPTNDDRETDAGSATDDDVSARGKVADAVTEAWRTRTPVLVSDGGATGATAGNAAADGSRFRSILAVPVGDDAVVSAAAAEPDAFDADDRRTVELLTMHAATQLERATARGPTTPSES